MRQERNQREEENSHTFACYLNSAEGSSETLDAFQ
jgi:hypothetical protein